MSSVLICTVPYRFSRMLDQHIEPWAGLVGAWKAAGLEVHFGEAHRDGGTTRVYRLDQQGVRTEEVISGATLVIGESQWMEDEAVDGLTRWARRRSIPAIWLDETVELAQLPEIAAPLLRLPELDLTVNGAARRLPLPAVYCTNGQELGENGNDADDRLTLPSPAAHCDAWLRRVRWEITTGHSVRQYDLAQVRGWLAVGLHGAGTSVKALLCDMYRFCSDADLTDHRDLVSILWSAIHLSRPQDPDFLDSGLAVLALARSDSCHPDFAPRVRDHLESVASWVRTQEGGIPTFLTHLTRTSDSSAQAANATWDPNSIPHVLLELRTPILADPLGALSAAVLDSPLTWTAAAQHRSPPEVVAEVAARMQNRSTSLPRLRVMLRHFVAVHPPQSAEMVEEWVAIVRGTRSRRIVGAICKGARQWPVMPAGLAAALNEPAVGLVPPTRLALERHEMVERAWQARRKL